MEIRRITSLDATELLSALWNSGTEDRIVIFDVSGQIEIPYPYGAVVNSRRVYVLGNTSPGGITITGAPLSLVNCQDISLEHLRFRMGLPATTADAPWWNPLKIVTNGLADTSSRSRRLQVRHCSFAGGTDENIAAPDNISAWGPNNPALEDISIRNCIYAFPWRAMRGEDGAPGKHNFGLMLTNVLRGRVSGCLFAHCYRRCPQVYGWDCLISNNLIYNYGTMAIGTMGGRMQVTDNLFIRGTNTRKTPVVAPISVQAGYDGELQIHHSGNILQNPQPGSIAFTNEVPDRIAVTELNTPFIRICDDEEFNLLDVGCCYRDAWDEMAIADPSFGVAGRTYPAGPDDLGGMPVCPTVVSPMILPDATGEELLAALRSYRHPD